MAERDDEVDPRYAAVFQRGYDPARHPDAAPPEERDADAPAPDASAPDTADPDTADPDTDPPDPDAAPPTRTPWRAALPIAAVSAAMLLGVVVLLLIPTPTESSFALSFPALLRDALLPALALGGGVGLALAVVVAAVRIRRDDD